MYGDSNICKGFSVVLTLICVHTIHYYSGGQKQLYFFILTTFSTCEGPWFYLADTRYWFCINCVED